MTCSLALCTCSLDAQVDQEGIGEADQMQVCHGRPVRAILVLTESQRLLERRITQLSSRARVHGVDCEHRFPAIIGDNSFPSDPSEIVLGKG
jgi:hypothetical protein